MKYSFELKETLPRRLLRYTLWTILLGGAAVLVWNGSHFAYRVLTERSMNSSAGGLAQISPWRSLTVAENLCKVSPGDNTNLRLIRVAADVGEWALADMLLDEYRPSALFKAQALDVIITSRVAPEALPGAIARLKAIPDNDDERILLAQAAFVSGNKELLTLGRRALGQLQGDFFRNRAILLLSGISLEANEKSNALELAQKLIDQPLSPGDSLQLLNILETLKSPLAGDYLSSLRVNARRNPAVALALGGYMLREQAPALVATWMASLPPVITHTPEVAIRLAALHVQADNKPAAIATLEKIENPNLQKTLPSFLANPPSLAPLTLTPSELIVAATFAQYLNLPSLQLEALSRINAHEPRLWSLQQSLMYAEALQDASAEQKLRGELNNLLPGNAINQAYGAYHLLLNEPDTLAQRAYAELKDIAAKYPDRAEIKAFLAFAHYRLGNVTEALTVLPETLPSPRAQLIAVVIYTKAGQYERASEIAKEIPQERLNAAEVEMYKAADSQLQANTPLRQLFDILKTN